MLDNKKGSEWFWLITIVIAVGILVVSWFFVSDAFGGAKTNLKSFQDCESKKGGHCEELETSCKEGETALYKALGCGDEKNDKTKTKPYCCLPSP